MKHPIRKSEWVFLLTVLFLTACVDGKDKAKEIIKTTNNYYVAAYVWPSCHHDTRFGEMLWPEGEGEWEVIRKGNPRYEGHYQPRQPLWGYEMDNDPKVVERWIDVALDHGINTFVYDWYWFDDGPFLESALNDGFLKAPNNEEMNFYLMWANHDVKKNYWNVHKFGEDESILWDGAVNREQFRHIVERVINQYFSKQNYLKFNGMPVFSIFSIDNLVEGFGSLEATREALNYFREEVKKSGFPDLHIQWNQGGGSVMTDNAAKAFTESVEQMGFNSVAMYNMGGLNEDYLRYGEQAVKIREQMDELLDIPVFPCVSIGWDDTPRFPAKGAGDVVRLHNTPDSFAALLSLAKQYADTHTEQPKLITINAWNEWVEGSYLLPDMLNGFDYLRAVKEVISGNYDPWMCND